jgi:S-adenosylmethionine synthetase
VAAKIATECEVQLAYIYGEEKPVSIHVDTFGTSKINNEELVKIISNVFNLKVIDIISNFNMKKIKYLPLSIYGHFGRDEYDYP